jgi:hypothetical protein
VTRRLVDENNIFRRRLRQAIFDHIRINPEVSDTSAGIVQWWLPSDGFERAVDVIDEVLDELVDAGVLRRRRLADGGVVYSSARVRSLAPADTKE